MNLPNKLTLLRILMVPVFIGCFYIPIKYWSFLAAAVFIIAYITDILDGHYARKHNIVTNFGKLMDPIADKLLTASAMIMLLSFDMLHPVYVLVVIAREFIISGFRLVSVESGIVIAANWLGKLKTITQCITVVLALIEPHLASFTVIPFTAIFMAISLVFTVWSAVDYIVKNKRHINFN